MAKATTCSVEICENEVLTRGWCNAHYQRWRKTGDVQAHIPIRRLRAKGSKPEPCSVDGCSNDAKGRGWCANHHRRWLAHGDVKADVPIREITPRSMHSECTVDGCVLAPTIRGLCNGHYDRFRRHGDAQADRPLKVAYQVGKECSVPGCSGPAFCRSWCGGHYIRWRKAGDVQADVPLRGDTSSFPEGMSWCSRCERMLPIDSFDKSGSTSNGVLRRCRKCVKAKRREDQPAANARAKEWRKKNPDKSVQYRRTHMAKHGDRVNARARQLRAENPVKYRAKDRAHEHRRRAKMRNAAGSVTTAQLRQRWSYYGAKCWICKVSDATVTDHVKPLAAGGSNWPSNLRPACNSCNNRKGALWPFDPSMILSQSA